MRQWNPVKQSGVVVESYKFTDTSEWTRTTIICHQKHYQHLLKGHNEPGHKTFSAPCQPGRFQDWAMNMTIFDEYCRKRETGRWHFHWMRSWTNERGGSQGLGSIRRQFHVLTSFLFFQWVTTNTKNFGGRHTYGLEVTKDLQSNAGWQSLRMQSFKNYRLILWTRENYRDIQFTITNTVNHPKRPSAHTYLLT